MVPPGPEARKPLRAPRTYICNIDVILVLLLLLPPLFRNVVYVKTTVLHIIIIIHLFAINKQSLTQSKEWQVTRET